MTTKINNIKVITPPFNIGGVIIKFPKGKRGIIKYNNFITYWTLTIGTYVYHSSEKELINILNKRILVDGNTK